MQIQERARYCNFRNKSRDTQRAGGSFALAPSCLLRRGESESNSFASSKLLLLSNHIPLASVLKLLLRTVFSIYLRADQHEARYPAQSLQCWLDRIARSSQALLTIPGRGRTYQPIYPVTEEPDWFLGTRKHQYSRRTLRGGSRYYLLDGSRVHGTLRIFR